MVHFTQYLRPDGHQKTISIARPDEAEAQAAAIVAAGGRFEAEVLRTSDVAFEVVAGDRDDPFTVACELCPNGPDVSSTIDRLIANAHAQISDGGFIDTRDEP